MDMLIETKTIIVKAGTSNLVVERFSKPGPIEEIEGFIDLNVLVKNAKRTDETEEVIVMIRWESKKRGNAGKPVPPTSKDTATTAESRSLSMSSAPATACTRSWRPKDRDRFNRHNHTLYFQKKRLQPLLLFISVLILEGLTEVKTKEFREP